jgi:hypothetical protein
MFYQLRMGAATSAAPILSVRWAISVASVATGSQAYGEILLPLVA